MPTSNSFTGKLYFVAGIHNGREAFMGRAIDEPYEGFVTLEGKAVHFGNNGFLTVHPFATLTRFPIQDANITIHQIARDGVVFAEIETLIARSITQVSRSTHPLFFRWMETCLRRDAIPAGISVPSGAARSTGFANNPFFSFHEGFVASAAQFRRALFQAPQVHSSRELDKLIELEGNLTIEIGKVTNQIAIRFNQIVAREQELGVYIEAIQNHNPFQPNAAWPNTTLQIGGWTYLLGRLHIAKQWARRQNQTTLVREINAMIKEGIHALNEIILEHCSTLDLLIAESYAQYGIAAEIQTELSAFDGYTSAAGMQIENYDLNPVTNSPLATAGY